MKLIKNFNNLAITPERKTVLEIIGKALESIQPEKIVQKKLSFTNNVLKIQDRLLNLKEFNRIFLLGLGKGSAAISKNIEKMLGNFLTKGYVIDVEQEKFTNINFTRGTHPLPSRTNFMFTKRTIEQFNNLTIKDLVIVVISGGGSALFELPYKIGLNKLIEINKALLKTGLNIFEMNIIRKHLSKVKGGGLAKLLYPSTVISLIFSDVPGNDLSTIASGTTVKDKTTKEEAFDILKKYGLWEKLGFAQDDFLETPKEGKYFKNVSNILTLSNKTALMSMQKKAKGLGFKTVLYSDRLQGEARLVGKNLIEKTSQHTVLLAAGETTVKVKGKGIGGRNQEVILGSLPNIADDVTIASCASDGWDNSLHAGAIADSETIKKARSLKLNPQEFLNDNDSFNFFEKAGDGIITGRLPSNVSDLMIVLKK